MSRSLNTLNPQFRVEVDKLLRLCADEGITMVPYYALRTPWEQAKLWRQSRPAEQVRATIANLDILGAPFLAQVLRDVGPQNGPHVTNALPGNSWHQWGEAVDCYWLVDGNAEWSATKLVDGKNGYKVYAEKAVSIGLTPGGYWPRLKDWPHVQLRSADNPAATGMTWPQISYAMWRLFGSARSEDAGMMQPDRDASNSGWPLNPAFTSPAGWQTYYTPDTPASIFRGKFAICADGHPNAYHPNGCPPGLDLLGNAGRPGRWWGVVTGNGATSGTPVVQGASDPAPGFFVSMTALSDPSKPATTPECYVHAGEVPYVVLPQQVYRAFCPPSHALRLGDFGITYSLASGAATGCIFAELGPDQMIGEGSIRLAEMAGIVNTSPVHGGISSRDFIYLVFPGSGNGRLQDNQTIAGQADALFQAWGGLERLRAHVSQLA